MACGCLSGLLHALRLGGRAGKVDEAEEFAQRLGFVRTVPIFKKQLPAADIPKVAEALRARTHRPGEYLVRQGKMPNSSEPAFFLIDSGEAAVMVNGPDGEEFRGELCRGDHFGGGCLVDKRPYVASLVAGQAGCTTLSISQAQFEELGFGSRIKLPKRAAIYEGQAKKMMGFASGEGGSSGSRVTSKDEKDFIVAAMKKNTNVRALLEVDERTLQQIASCARKVTLPKGSQLYKQGDVGSDIFVVRDGKVELVPEREDKQRSAEEMAMFTPLAERAKRKQNFIEKMDRADSTNLHNMVPLTPAAAGQGNFRPAQRSGTLTRSVELQTSKLRPVRKTSLTMPRQVSSGLVPPRRKRVARSLLMSSSAEATPVMVGDWVVRNDESLEGVMPGTTSDFAKNAALAAPRRNSFGRAARHQTMKPAAVQPTRPQTLRPGQNVLQPKQEVEAEVGRVVDIDHMQRLVIAFPRTGTQVMKAKDVQLAKTTGSVTTIGSGVCFGEVAILYSVGRINSCYVSADNDATIFFISKRDFKECIDRKTAQHKAKFNEWCDVLDEVPSLATLFRMERMELAKVCTGEIQFSPGECCLRKGAPREPLKWYVVVSGSGQLYSETERPEDDAFCKEEPRAIIRGAVWGERSLLKKTYVSEVTILAGENGMTALAFEEEELHSMAKRAIITDPNSSLEAYLKDRCLSHDEEPDAYNIDPGNLSRVCKLGEGAFATVFLIKDSCTLKCYAEKRTSKRLVRRARIQKEIVNERDILSICQSGFVIRLLLSFKDEQFVYMVEEAACGGTLEKVVQFGKSWDHAQRSDAARFYVAGITAGLEHLHERHVVHRDIKPGNVLLSDRGYPKICDMGFARFIMGSGKAYTCCGTPEYMAPELIDFPNEHNHAVDWWALGVMAFELLHPKHQVPYWDGDAEGDQRPVIVRDGQRACPDPTSNLRGVPEVAKNMCRQLLNADPRKRLGGADSKCVRCHEWFNETSDFDFDSMLQQGLESPHVPDTFEPPEDDDDSFMAGAFVHEDNDAFREVEDDGWAPTLCRIDDGVFKKMDTGSFNAIKPCAVTKEAKVVRVCKPEAELKGVLRFGLTTDRQDSVDFEHGFAVALMPGLQRCQADKATYKMPGTTTDEVTLCIEEDRAVVYQADQKVCDLGPAKKSGMYAKVFLTQKEVAITAYEEPEEDPELQKWDENFKLPDAMQRLIDCNTCRGHSMKKNRSKPALNSQASLVSMAGSVSFGTSELSSTTDPRSRRFVPAPGGAMAVSSQNSLPGAGSVQGSPSSEASGSRVAPPVYVVQRPVSAAAVPLKEQSNSFQPPRTQESHRSGVSEQDGRAAVKVAPAIYMTPRQIPARGVMPSRQGA